MFRYLGSKKKEHGNGEYMGTYTSQCFPFKFFKIYMTKVKIVILYCGVCKVYRCDSYDSFKSKGPI